MANLRDTDRSRTATEPMTAKRRVFIAHARADRDVAAYFDDLGPALADWCVIRVQVSDDWWTEAEERIRTCDAFVFVDTEAARASPWCLQELRAAELASRPVHRVSRVQLGMLAETLEGGIGPVALT